MKDPYGKAVAHSYSSLKAFENCALAFEQLRILKMYPYVQGKEAEFGDIVHKDIENYLKLGSELGPEALPYKDKIDTIRKGVAGLEFVVEEQLVITSNLKPTTWWAKNAWFRVKIDWMLFNNAEHAIMFDWKTGKKRPDPFQLEVFATLVFLIYPEVKKVSSAYVWLKENPKDLITRETYTREADFTKLLVNLLRKTTRVERAIKANVYPARPSGLCGWCQCQPDCAFGKK